MKIFKVTLNSGKICNVIASFHDTYEKDVIFSFGLKEFLGVKSIESNIAATFKVEDVCSIETLSLDFTIHKIEWI